MPFDMKGCTKSNSFVEIFGENIQTYVLVWLALFTLGGKKE